MFLPPSVFIILHTYRCPYLSVFLFLSLYVNCILCLFLCLWIAKLCPSFSFFLSLSKLLSFSPSPFFFFLSINPIFFFLSFEAIYNYPYSVKYNLCPNASYKLPISVCTFVYHNHVSNFLLRSSFHHLGQNVCHVSRPLSSQISSALAPAQIFGWAFLELNTLGVPVTSWIHAAASRAPILQNVFDV